MQLRTPHNLSTANPALLLEAVKSPQPWMNLQERSSAVSLAERVACDSQFASRRCEVNIIPRWLQRHVIIQLT